MQMHNSVYKKLLSVSHCQRLMPRIVSPHSRLRQCQKNSYETKIEITEEKTLSQRKVLLPCDKEDVLTGKWLSDRVIHSAQTLLAKQFPFIQGLQDPLNKDLDGFNMMKFFINSDRV